MSKLEKSPFNLDRIAKAKQWYRIENKRSDKAKLYLMDEISFWGITAQDFVNDLQEIQAKEIELHINSPGGDAWDGIAIHNALVDHDAKITVIVDGIAASAASVIAMAGSEIVMAAGSTLMIHDASGLVWGNAQDMKKMASTLDKLSDQIAGFYAAKAGGSVTEWRDAMREESWYTDKEAVEAGLAHRALKADDGEEDKAENLANRFDLSVFDYAGRDLAPEPATKKPELLNEAGRFPGISANSSRTNNMIDNKETTATATLLINTQEDKPLTADQLQKLGLPEDATQEQIDERLDALAALESTSGGDGGDGDGGEGGNGTPPADPPAENTTPSGEVVPGTQPENTPSAEATNRAMNSVPEGVSMIDTARLEALEANAEYVNTLREEQRVAKRDELITNAIAQGKFPPDRKAHWANLYDKDPQGTEDFITNKLAAGAVPLEEIGHGKDSAIENKADEAYSSDFFPHLQAQGAAQ